VTGQQCYTDDMEYTPGDIANGYVLGTDNAWHPVGVVAPQEPMRYWARYWHRWRITYLVFAVLAPLSMLGTRGGAARFGLLDLLFAATVSAAFVASIVNLLVAAFPRSVR
jgi:hypothetical protein